MKLKEIIPNPQSITKYIRTDPSTMSLLLSNLITIIFAVVDNWNLTMVMWIYWGQSVSIGIINFFRILSLKNFSTEGFQINKRSVQPTKSVQVQTAFFFLFHYGFFHLVYAIFLFMTSEDGEIDLQFIFLGTALFFINHLFSFFYNRKSDAGKKQNIGTVMAFPYARIIPLHITIVFGFMLATGVFGMIFFLSLKTLADLIMHMIEHRTDMKLNKILQ